MVIVRIATQFSGRAIVLRSRGFFGGGLALLARVDAVSRSTDGYRREARFSLALQWHVSFRIGSDTLRHRVSCDEDAGVENRPCGEVTRFAALDDLLRSSAKSGIHRWVRNPILFAVTSARAMVESKRPSGVLWTPPQLRERVVSIDK